MAQDIMISSDIHGNLDNNNTDFTNYMALAVPAIGIVIASFKQISQERDFVALR